VKGPLVFSIKSNHLNQDFDAKAKDLVMNNEEVVKILRVVLQ